ncbi:hypothetical protein [Avibacterium paragallinarum]|uniref:hypothetical protein n=1 Tax=Avibacterium paragallinarum TaxID=728 RepID=UPI00187CB31E|nr:hypothetical protein [Avibacterium paragallinarum]
MFASLSLGVTFLKILFPFGQFTRERAIFKSAVVFEGYFCIWKNQENGFRKYRTFVFYFWIFGLMTFFFGSYNGFRSLSDLLSFAFPKESKQRKGNPTKLLFLIPIKFSSRKVSLMFASLSLGVTFLKILFPFGQFTRERAIFKSAVVF